MALYKPDGTRLEPAFTDIRSPYIARVLQMARGRYHRGEDQFSATARTLFADTNLLVDHLVSDLCPWVEARVFKKDDAFMGALGKFQRYALEKDNAFPAYHCMKRVQNHMDRILNERWI